jgi:hypothetical protein
VQNTPYASLQGLIQAAKAKPGTIQLRDAGKRFHAAPRDGRSSRARRAYSSRTFPTRAARKRSPMCLEGSYRSSP